MNETATVFISYLCTQSRVVFLCRPGAESLRLGIILSQWLWMWENRFPKPH